MAKREEREEKPRPHRCFINQEEDMDFDILLERLREGDIILHNILEPDCDPEEKLPILAALAERVVNDTRQHYNVEALIEILKRQSTDESEDLAWKLNTVLCDLGNNMVRMGFKIGYAHGIGMRHVHDEILRMKSEEIEHL